MYDVEEEVRAMLLAYRLDPNLYYEKSGGPGWCRKKHPKSDFVCSREKGHTGLHFALVGGMHGDAAICSCEPNPWK